MQEDLVALIQKQCLETCFNLPGYDYKIERVSEETAKLFASQELQQRLRDKKRIR